MYLTREEVLNLDFAAYDSIGAIKRAVMDKYACGISDETAKKIISDYHLLTKTN